jgi:hypothetical protein
MPILASVEEHIMNIMTNNLFGSWRVTKLPLFWLGRLSLSVSRLQYVFARQDYPRDSGRIGCFGSWTAEKDNAMEKDEKAQCK